MKPVTALQRSWLCASRQWDYSFYELKILTRITSSSTKHITYNCVGCRFYLLPIKISCTVSTVNELTWCCRRDTCRAENWTLLSKYLLHCLHCASQGFPNPCVFLQPLSWMKFKNKNKKKAQLLTHDSDSP